MRNTFTPPRFDRALAALLLAVAGAMPAFALAPVDLRSAGNFTILTKSGISTTGTTAITGNIGVSPIDSTAITGFGLSMDPSNQFATSSLVNGDVFAADYAPPTPSVMTTAVSDMELAYTDAAGRTLPTATELGAGNIGGMTLAPGLYKWSSGVIIPTDLTLSGNASAVWIFQIAQTLDLGSATKVLLAGGALARNIFWQVGGQATLATTSVMQGTILGQTAIVLNTGAILHGKALAQTAVTLDAAMLDSAAGSYTGPNPPGRGATFAYPSPTRTGPVNLVYSMAEAGHVNIRVWNANADLVSTLDEQKLAGPQKSQLAVGRFAAGVYLYIVKMSYASGQVETLGVRKFTVTK